MTRLNPANTTPVYYFNWLRLTAYYFQIHFFFRLAQVLVSVKVFWNWKSSPQSHFIIHYCLFWDEVHQICKHEPTDLGFSGFHHCYCHTTSSNQPQLNVFRTETLITDKQSKMARARPQSQDFRTNFQQFAVFKS